MKTEILKKFQSEVARQCRFAIFAFQDLEQAIQAEYKDSDRIWYYIQALLIAAANVSKLLYLPENKGFSKKKPKNDFAERKKLLRESLDVSNDSILLTKGIRDIRNHFEHFDERLDTWAASENHSIVDSCIGDSSVYEFYGMFDKKQCFRILNYSDWELIFQGDFYNLKNIIDAIKQLESVAQAKSSQS